MNMADQAAKPDQRILRLRMPDILANFGSTVAFSISRLSKDSTNHTARPLGGKNAIFLWPHRDAVVWHVQHVSAFSFPHGAWQKQLLNAHDHGLIATEFARHLPFAGKLFSQELPLFGNAGSASVLAHRFRLAAVFYVHVL